MKDKRLHRSSSLSLPLPDVDATRALGRRLAVVAIPGDIFYLDGPLGAGKTCFVQGLAQGVGATDAVVSPTFTLINEYGGGRLRLVHWDLYRLPTPVDVQELGWDDYLDQGTVMAIEWAERMADEGRDASLHLHFAPGMDGEGRIVSITSSSPSWNERLATILPPQIPG